MKWLSLIFLSHVCVVQCHSISASEIEDFNNFLKETSRLDYNVKSVSPDDYDEDELISDHAWEESGKFEGDLILNDRQRRLIVADVAEGLARNGLTDTTKRWPNNEVIYFIQREHFTSDQVQAIQNGIDDLARASCVKFSPYRKGDRDAVVIQGSRRGCFSQVGYQGGYQVLNLSGRHPVGRGCFRHGTVVHELLHTLGFYHMQSSPDRDDYIEVVWENILKPARHNFRKYNSFAVSDFGVGYDYESVLHYSRKAFSSNGQDTLVPKQGGADIGQRIGLSQKDVQKLNKMYCDADSDTAEENSDASKKSTSKKKTKNKPFQGHGIGYQQGKTVVIKLPTAEVYNLQDSPQFQMFDYFSSTTKALPAASFEGFRTGKEINYEFLPLEVISQKDIKSIPIIPKPEEQSLTRELPVTNYKQMIKSEADNSDIDDDLKEAFYKLSSIAKPHTHLENLSVHNVEPPVTDKVTEDYDLTDAFYKLPKIVKPQNPENNPNYNYYESPGQEKLLQKNVDQDVQINSRLIPSNVNRQHQIINDQISTYNSPYTRNNEQNNRRRTSPGNEKNIQEKPNYEKVSYLSYKLEPRSVNKEHEDINEQISPYISPLSKENISKHTDEGEVEDKSQNFRVVPNNNYQTEILPDYHYKGYNKPNEQNGNLKYIDSEQYFPQSVYARDKEPENVYYDDRSREFQQDERIDPHQHNQSWIHHKYPFTNEQVWTSDSIPVTHRIFKNGQLNHEYVIKNPKLAETFR